ncbi:uncharacterized protein LOC111884930 isoform X4 [Lactuca sativa]|uniref:uncharacterized protein LOC111884930 isoform X4 n=1 Tax=Lactuca sativa TaxID=4236 RepID=UPI000CD7F7DF|nr:uncharacterized protein LOC111884930 isoform X4 [Lactuca sativa]
MHCFDSTMHFGVDMFQKFSAPIAPKIIWAGICLCLHLGLVMIMFSVRVRSRYTTDMGVRLLSSDRDLFRAGFDVRRGMMPGGVDAGRDPKPDGAQWWWSKAQCTFGTNEKGPM